MTIHKNDIIMIKRWTPKTAQLPNGRVFYAKYLRTSKNVLPANVLVRRTYRRNPVQRGKRRQLPRVRAKPAHTVRGRGFGKMFNIVKKVTKSSLAKKNWKDCTQRTSKCL